MSYSNQIEQLRAARKERDDAKEMLYSFKLKYFALTKEQKKAAQKEMVPGKDHFDAVTAVRNAIAKEKEQLNKVEEKQQALLQLQQLFNEKSSGLKGLQDDLLKVKKRIAAIEEELKSQQLTAAQRTSLDDENKKLLSLLEGLQNRIVSLQQETTGLGEKIQNGQDVNSNLVSQAKKLSAGIGELNHKLNDLTGQSVQYPDRQSELDDLKAQIEKQKGIITGKEKGVSDLLANLYGDLTPQELVQEWDDGFPVMLLPVRIETKFKLSEKQLWVRVFPDEIAISSHEKTLTQTEIDYGIAYWKALWKAASTEDKKSAWRMLTDKFGANRSAWIALQTKPEKWAIAATIINESDLQFPTFDVTKLNSWTQAPSSYVMPDKFVLLAYKQNQLKHTKVGEKINDELIVGPAPMNDLTDPSITRNESDGTLNYGDDVSWLKDFDSAVAAGMGFKLDLTNASDLSGFDQLLVIGLKLSADEVEGQELIGDLFADHTYSLKGMNFVPQGTPTNNTEEGDSGYSIINPFDTIDYFTEAGSPAFEVTNSRDEKSDGQRMAEYLGLDYSSLQNIFNSNTRDNVEAIAMNKAMYPATLGYFIQSMLNAVMPDDTIAKLRDHFSNYVTGRGPVSAIRVGNQPYGILPTSVFSKWTYADDADPFLKNTKHFLSYLETQWKKQVPTLSHVSKQGDASKNLMQVLGLQPNAVEYFQRISYSYDYLKNIENFGWGGSSVSNVFKPMLEGMYANTILEQFGYNKTNADGTPKQLPLLFQMVFQYYQTRLDYTNLIDSDPLSETNSIKCYDKANTLNYIDWLLQNLKDADQLEKENFGDGEKPNALLYLLLRHSLLIESSHEIAKVLSQNNISADEMIRSRKFMNISSAPSVSHWEVFKVPANKVIPNVTSTLPLMEYIHTAPAISMIDSVGTDYLQEHQWALNILKDLPTAHLERAMTEHLDTLSYRLDAWQTSLFTRRLEDQRQITGSKSKRGIYIGAYGYLENVKPDPGNRIAVPESTLPLELRENKENLFIEKNNGGYVHTPSLNHAAAAALLRNGYLTHASPEDQEILSINLSSERVRRAKNLIDGIRNGQTLEVLLGYQFERGLQDWATREVNPVIVTNFIPDFRTAFPIKKTKIPQAGNVTGPEETIENYDVVNGLTLAQLKTPFPYGISSLSTLSDEQASTITTEKENLENTLDALRDVLTTESAYQLSLGNFDRAAGAMQAISSAQLPSEIESINSSRGTALSFTNRVTIHFNTAFTTTLWSEIPMTRRATTEPALNQWAAMLIGKPSEISCKVTALDQDGNLTAADTVLLQDLQIQAIDLMYLINNKLEASGASELEARVRYVFAQKNNIEDSSVVKIEFSESGSSDPLIKSFTEVMPFINYVKTLVSSSRTLTAKDYEPASQNLADLADNPGNVDAVELQTRVQNAFTEFVNLSDALPSLVDDASNLQTESAVNALRDKLKSIADSGYVYAFPQSATGFAAEEISILVAQGQSLLMRFADLKDNYNTGLAKVNDVSSGIDQKITLLTEMGKNMLGDDFVFLPKFYFNNPDDVGKSYSATEQLLKYSKETLQVPLPVDEWLHGVALVRPKMHTFEMVNVLNDTFNENALAMNPLQLPYRDNDTWLAMEFDENMSIDHDMLAFLQHCPLGFDASIQQSGILIDEWTEVIPNKEEVTGITFNFNQPDSAPPQTILLAITPEETGSWKWEDLVETILDTIDRAKRRAVEPDMLDKINGLSTLLPALMSEFNTTGNTISLDYSLNISTITNEIAALNKKQV